LAYAINFCYLLHEVDWAIAIANNMAYNDNLKRLSQNWAIV